MIDQIQDTTVILRECGEYTADQSYELLCQTFGPNAVHRVSETPFSRSLSTSLQLGIIQDKKFTLCLDADVIPIPNNLLGLIEEFRALPSQVSEIQGMVFDNFFRVNRPAGNHIYRTSLAPKAISLIPAEENSLRPESDMLSKLTRHGNPWFQSTRLVGYHDFGQSPKDVYRKSLLTAKKHSEYRHYLSLLWASLANHSAEFLVAQMALEDSYSLNRDIRVDKNFLANEISEKIANLNLDEDEGSRYLSGALDRSSLIDELSSELKAMRTQCEESIRRKIFLKPRSLARRLLSTKMLELILSP